MPPAVLRRGYFGPVFKLLEGVFRVVGVVFRVLRGVYRIVVFSVVVGVIRVVEAVIRLIKQFVGFGYIGTASLIVYRVPLRR